MVGRWWFGAVALALLALFGCTMGDAEKYIKVWVRNANLCKDHGGRKDIEWGTEAAIVTCNDGKGYKVWYWKETDTTEKKVEAEN